MDIGFFILFIVLWFSIYGGLHYYIYRKFIPIIPHQRRWLIGGLILLASLLFVAELLTHNAYASVAFPLSGVAYTWMGLVFMFFIYSGPLDLVEILCRRLHLVKIARLLGSRYRTLGIASLIFILGVYGVVVAQHVTVERIPLNSSKIIQDTRLVQISDLHLGILSSRGSIARVVKTINDLHPDIVVSTGDLVDMQLNDIRGLANELKKIKAPLGKFAIYGNHEAFAGVAQSSQVIEESGFSLLSNRVVSPGGVINLAGVDDPAIAGRLAHNGKQETELLATLHNNLFTVLLKHQPVVEQASLKYFDLQLSGHTHGGQIFPFGLLTKLVYPIGFGLTAMDNNWIYVSRGTGTWGPPMRILSGAEISLFELRNDGLGEQK